MEQKGLVNRLKDKLSQAVVSDEMRQKVSFLLLNGSLAVTSGVMTVINIFTGEHLLMLSTLLFAICCLVNFILIYCAGCPKKIVSVFFCVEVMVLLGFFLVSGIPHGFSAIWICLVPSFALLVFGMRGGSVLCGAEFLIVVFFFWTSYGNSLLRYDYGSTFLLRFPFLLLASYVIAVMIEYVRMETQKQLERTKNEFYKLYRHDALTGLYNRYGISEYIEEVFAEAKDRLVSVVLLDIDNFKMINDKYGHEAGDQVLKTIACVLLQAICKDCHCCRWGGEEFLLIMQCEHDAPTMAEIIRHRIEREQIFYKDQQIPVTVSIGIRMAKNVSDTSIHEMIDQADNAMYLSKLKGKNCVTVSKGFE